MDRFLGKVPGVRMAADWSAVSRRALLRAGILMAAVAGGTPAARAAGINAKNERAALLAKVRYWGCQYQKIDIGTLAGSELDLVVIEPIRGDGSRKPWPSSDIQRLRRKPDGSRRLVLGYLSVGEAESFRPYWQATWNDTPPEWIGPENPRWPGSRSVRFWRPEWQSIVLDDAVSGLAAILDAGFDGVFLDRVDAYDDWRAEDPPRGEDMVAFVERIAATARKSQPEFLVISQNAEPLVAAARYLAAIDAISKESLLTGLAGPNVPNTQADTNWSLQSLLVAQALGVQVFAIEYASDDQLIAAVAARLQQLRFKPFFATRLLDVLPQVHPVQRTTAR